MLLSRLTPPLALMALIFYLSHQPSLGTGLGVWDLILRKGAHITAFGLLCLAWNRALGGRVAAAAAVTLVYAATDEYHQTFIEGRHGTPVDWLIDAVGVAIAVVLIRRRQQRRPRRGGAFA